MSILVAIKSLHKLCLPVLINQQGWCSYMCGLFCLVCILGVANRCVNSSLYLLSLSLSISLPHTHTHTHTHTHRPVRPSIGNMTKPTPPSTRPPSGNSTSPSVVKGRSPSPEPYEVPFKITDSGTYSVHRL